MPLYELLCLSKPLMARQELAALMRQCGELLCTGGGVITGIKSYGNQELAYNIRRPFEKYGEVSVGCSTQDTETDTNMGTTYKM